MAEYDDTPVDNSPIKHLDNSESQLLRKSFKRRMISIDEKAERNEVSLNKALERL